MGQVINKFKKSQPSQGQIDKLKEDMVPIVAHVCEELEKKGTVDSDDLYHAIYEIIEKLRKENGAMQYELPPKEDLQKEFKDAKKTGGPLKKDECSKIINNLIALDRFSIGQGAIDILLYLFGIPIGALLAKKYIPGMRSVSDDVVIPAATSASVVFLAKTNKL